MAVVNVIENVLEISHKNLLKKGKSDASPFSLITHKTTDIAGGMTLIAFMKATSNTRKKICVSRTCKIHRCEVKFEVKLITKFI